MSDFLVGYQTLKALFDGYQQGSVTLEEIVTYTNRVAAIGREMGMDIGTFSVAETEKPQK